MKESRTEVDRNGIPVLNKPDDSMFDFNGEPLIFDDELVEEMIGEKYEEEHE